MDTTALAWIWFLLPSILNSIKVTSSITLNSHFMISKSPDDFLRDLFENDKTPHPRNPTERIDIDKPEMLAFRRSYRKAKPAKSTDMNPVEQTTSYNLNKIPNKYNSLEPTELSDESKKVIPLTKPESYHSPEPQNVNDSNEKAEFGFPSTIGYFKPDVSSIGITVTPEVTTEEYNSLKVPYFTDKENTNEPNDLSDENNTKLDYFGSTSNTNEAVETVTQFSKWKPLTEMENIVKRVGSLDDRVTTDTESTYPTLPNKVASSDQSLTPIEIENVTVNPLNRWQTTTGLKVAQGVDKELEVIGINSPKVKINETELIERMMVRQPSKEENAWLIQTVHDLTNYAMLQRETENYVIEINRRYNDLPVVEADNSSWRKYSRAVAENFVLDFCLNYPRYTVSDEFIARWDPDVYPKYYNITLYDFQKKKKYSALQFAAPVKRNADILRSILDTPIGIVQSKCGSGMPHWLCIAEYEVHLAEEWDNCKNIWYHAQVHLTILQSRRKSERDTADIIIDNLNSRLSRLEHNDDINYLFDFIMETLRDIGSQLKNSLLDKASLHHFIRRMQWEENLTCLNIHNKAL